MHNSHNKTLISVLLPTYNAGSFLRPALTSILRQTYSNLEVIIVDDGSTDESLENIKDIIDKRVTVIHQKNSGKAAALNNALEIIKGDYWLVQDADDLSYPDRVAKLHEALSSNKELAAVFSGHDLLIHEKQFAPTNSTMTVEQCRTQINALKMPAHDATGLYRSNLLKDFRWDPELKIGEGIDFILRVGETFPICRINHCLYTYRINFQSLIRKNPEENIRWVNQAIRKACIRRGLDFSKHQLVEKSAGGKQSKSNLNHIVSHCMESVVDLKNSGNWIKAVQTGMACLCISPDNYMFYKPMIYSLLPLSIIKRYRKNKLRINNSVSK